jgi:hypothetical protein
LVKEVKVPLASKRVIKGSDDGKGRKGKKAASTSTPRAVRSLRGRAVEYSS